ncbi:unnamed protein product [Angiostrongylus costaricensis]|uniref:LAM_G_DOMAIN domain-containing protein n=1 Tax=Angiostrongylus costaricensis TaxID=334426 RepID=A0A158PKQ6_ANGCS|nr:unnamed protein product [Angiostrongylus costaricensis]
MSVADASRPRRSCRHHYLANVYKTSVLPLKGEEGVFNIVCHMPSADDDTVATEVHSGLSRAHKVPSTLLPMEMRPVPGNEQAEYSLVGPRAGIRHILPHNWADDIEATVVASPLLCRQKTVLLPNCLFRSKVVVSVKPGSTWIWEFAFRSQRSDQILFSLHTVHSQIVHIRIQKDFFLRVDSEPLIPIGQLSDGLWHTVTIYSKHGSVLFTVDDSYEIHLPQFTPQESRLSAIAVEVEGEILLIDPQDTSENCELNERRQAVGSAQKRRFCSGCDCGILKGIFENFPASPICSQSNDKAYHMMRDTDRLSFFFVKSSYNIPEHSEQRVRIGLSYKSDSDIGLLLFGFWQNEEEKGRFQVHYTGRNLAGIYCVNVDEEICRGCTLYEMEGFGNDKWHRVLFFEIDGEISLVVDRSICILRQHDISNNFSLAEVYSIPVLATASALFIGGTYYEKKKADLYLPSFEHKYFENTREKVPSLRGCLKDVYVDGTKVDLTSIYGQQMKTTLINPTDDKAYAIQVGCTGCSPSCPQGVRCRPTDPRQLTFQCDCSDIEEFTLGLQPNPLVPLSTAYLDSSAPVLRLLPTKAATSKVWMKLSFPRKIEHRTTVAQFNSHREMLFYIFVDPEGVGIHVHPNTFDQFETIIKEPISFSDERVHLITLERKTPLGTRYISKKFDLSIDGVHCEIPDVAKYMLNNVTILAAEDGSNGSVIIHVAASWLMYSLMLTTILCVLLTVFLIAYCCVLHRRRGRCSSHSSDRDRILRDSPDYSVKMRLSKTESISTYDGDGSIGTEDTDLNAYRDIPSHRVKIYRESMVSILVPGVDQPNNAIVKRVPSTGSDLSAPLLSSSPAPLVNVDDQ